MKFGIRKPSFKKRIAARTSWKRVIRHNLGLKAPRGFGWLTNPKKAVYNRIYNRTTISADKVIGAAISAVFSAGKAKPSTSVNNIASKILEPKGDIGPSPSK